MASEIVRCLDVSVTVKLLGEEKTVTAIRLSKDSYNSPIILLRINKHTSLEDAEIGIK